MALSDGQVQVRGLVMGCDTPYTVVEFAPWSRTARTTGGEGRAWNHGSWSGAEWLAETVVGFRVRVYDRDDRSPATWLAAQQALIAAFEPVGDAVEDVELRFATAGQEFVMVGRPRSAEVDAESLRVHRGKSWVSVAFVALDPRIYAAERKTAQTGLPSFAGGLTAPLQVPFVVGGVMVSGRAEVTNTGTAATPLRMRIDGPVVRPRVTVQHPDGTVQTLRIGFDLGVGQWVDIDTGTHTVLLNGVANRRGQVSGQFPRLSAGTSTVRFMAADHNEDAQLTVAYRSAW